MGNVELTKRMMMMTRATAMTLIVSIDMRTTIMMMKKAMAILPLDNNDVDGNVEDSYNNDVDHDDDSS